MSKKTNNKKLDGEELSKAYSVKLTPDIARAVEAEARRVDPDDPKPSTVIRRFIREGLLNLKK